MSEEMIAKNGNEVLLSVNNVKKYFPVTRGILQRKVGEVKAVDGLSFDIKKGETFGLVGESGCGKTVAGRAILQLYRPTAGQVSFDGVDLVKLKGNNLRRMRRRIQLIFQDPFASLDPRMPVGRIVREPLDVHGIKENRKARKEWVEEVFRLVGLNPYFVERYAHEFSGGQKQRVGIARALVSQPDFIVCDDPISALDVSIQAQIVNLLQDLQEQFGITYLFVANDLSMIRYISDRIAMMYLGRIVELADRVQVYENPLHPYTQALLSAVQIPDPDVPRNRIPLSGEIPTAANPPQGCNFCTRCPARERVRKEKGIDCNMVEPEFRELETGHWVTCHLYS